MLAGAGIDLDDARRKREDNIVQLRKDRRDENLQKKRMVSAVAAEGGELESNRAGQVQQKVRAPRALQVGATRRCCRRLPPPPATACLRSCCSRPARCTMWAPNWQRRRAWPCPGLLCHLPSASC